ncbi:hypothetical protein MD484_g5799, partial [Candolleomyces efflorescens]
MPRSTAPVPVPAARSKHAHDPLKKRCLQRVTSGLGTLFVSPKKSRATAKKTKPPTLFGHDLLMQSLQMELEALEDQQRANAQPQDGSDIEETGIESAQPPSDAEQWMDIDNLDSITPGFELPTPFDNEVYEENPAATSLPPRESNKRRLTPNRRTQQLYDRWLALIPSLIEPYLLHYERSYQQDGPPPLSSPSIAGCTNPQCVQKHGKSKVLCFYTHHFKETEVEWCASSSLPALLIEHGLFPGAPYQPRHAFSIELLGFFKSLFERSCDATYALANALRTHYLRRGFRLTNPKGDIALDPFRKSLTSAMQWFDCLVQLVERKTEAIIQEAAAIAVQPSEPQPPQCDRVLQTRCPSCFAGRKFGSACDIVVSVDGCFNHRHVRSRGDCPAFYDPDYMLSKESVDQVGSDIEEARKRPAKSRQPQVPDEAIDACQDSHEAGSGSNVKTSLEHFDDGGVMALVCRHDIPLFLANIDTPGEQQKYAFALIKHLFARIPPTATVKVLYDVGCVVDRSRELYAILEDKVSSRLSFATSIMHSYAHEFSCQIVYNPRYQSGLGLSDGEGTERLWSRLTGLIGLTRMCGRRKRIYYLDRQVAAIGAEMRDELGITLRHRAEKNVPSHEKTANQALAKVQHSADELKKMWEQQKKTQLSVRSHAPARVKKELEVILNLQSELEGVEHTIQCTRKFIATLRSASDVSKSVLDTLESRQQEIGRQVETLYASLNIHEAFPELKGVELEFVRCLLLARDIKMNIRKRAVGSFHEYDKLNQAQAGGGAPIGTKAHQYYRQSIAKRMPALRKLIRKFNDLCAQAKARYKPQWNIPLPQPLPEEIAKLKKDPGLMEDVWISSAPCTSYQWLYDANIREAMRAIHRKERCLEEVRRLGIELDNLCRWFGSEMKAVEIALALPNHAKYRSVLNHYRSRILNLKGQWSTRTTAPLFESHVKSAQAAALEIHAQHAGQPPSEETSLTWLRPLVTGAVEDVEDEEATLVAEESIIGVDGAMRDLDDEEREGMSEDGDGLFDDTLEKLEAPSIVRMDNPTVDHQLLKRLQCVTSIPAMLENAQPRVLVVPYPDHARRYVFGKDVLDRLSTATSRLNDECINNLSVMIQVMLAHTDVGPKASACSIFSSYELTLIRQTQPTQGSERIWANVKHLQYWQKQVWIIPIHRRIPHEHWPEQRRPMGNPGSYQPQFVSYRTGCRPRLHARTNPKRFMDYPNGDLQGPPDDVL